MGLSEKYKYDVQDKSTTGMNKSNILMNTLTISVIGLLNATHSKHEKCDVH